MLTVTMEEISAISCCISQVESDGSRQLGLGITRRLSIMSAQLWLAMIVGSVSGTSRSQEFKIHTSLLVIIGT